MSRPNCSRSFVTGRLCRVALDRALASACNNLHMPLSFSLLDLVNKGRSTVMILPCNTILSGKWSMFNYFHNKVTLRLNLIMFLSYEFLNYFEEK